MRYEPSLTQAETCLEPGRWMIDGCTVIRANTGRLWLIYGPCDEYGWAKTLADARLMIRGNEVPGGGWSDGDLSPAERAVVDRFDAAEPAPESLREQVARAMFDADDWHPDLWNSANWEGPADYRRRADAAIAVMRGQS